MYVKNIGSFIINKEVRLLKMSQLINICYNYISFFFKEKI